MARYFTLQIGSIYLTSTGLVGGLPCKLTIAGLEKLKPTKKKNIIKAIDGTPWSQVFATNKGFDLEVSLEWLDKTRYDDINTLFNSSDSTGTAIAIVITGDPGTFNLNVVPNQDYVSFDKFSNTILQGVKYRMVTT